MIGLGAVAGLFFVRSLSLRRDAFRARRIPWSPQPR
jgi:hypothetical protein